MLLLPLFFLFFFIDTLLRDYADFLRFDYFTQHRDQVITPYCYADTLLILRRWRLQHAGAPCARSAQQMRGANMMIFTLLRAAAARCLLRFSFIHARVRYIPRNDNIF